MTIVDKIIAAVTPPETAEERAKARTQARAIATPGGWLAEVLDHHLQIEDRFREVRAAVTAESRRAAERGLASLLTGHSLAEEAVLYPAMARTEQTVHSEKAYVEQSAAKVQLAGLELLDPMGQDYLDKLEHIRGAVAHHIFEEESKWFPELQQKADVQEQSRLAARFHEEFARYVGSTAV